MNVRKRRKFVLILPFMSGILWGTRDFAQKADSCLFIPGFSQVTVVGISIGNRCRFSSRFANY